MAAIRTNDSYLQALYRRKKPQRQTRRLLAQLERLGHTITLQEASAA